MQARLCCAVCCCVTVTLAVATILLGADPMRAGGATFTPPDGWKAQSQPDGLVRLVSPDDQAAIMVMPGPAFDGELAEAFDQSWAVLRQGLKVRKVVSGGKPESRVNGKGYETVRTEATVEIADGNRLACRYVLVRNGGALCGVAYVGSPESFERYNAVYGQLSGSFSLGAAKGDAGGKPAPAKEPADAAAGAPAADAAGEPAGRAAPADKGKPAPEPPTAEPGIVAGRITDIRGNVIQDARLVVTVSGTSLAGERSTFDIEVGEDGMFSQEVPDGLWRIYGFIEKEYGGHKYRLPLDPEDKREIGSTQGTRKGVVKNFVWRVAGLKPRADKSLPGSYYGGSVEFMDGRGLDDRLKIAARHPGTKLAVTFEPRGPLLDGTRGQPVNVECDIAALAGFTRPSFFNIPLGEYVARARLVAPNGASLPLNIAAGIVIPEGGARPSPAAKVVFVPQSAVESLQTLTMSVWE